MERFDVYKVDKQTFVVFDTIEQREICVCLNYDDWEDAEPRAKRLAKEVVIRANHNLFSVIFIIDP